MAHKALLFCSAFLPAAFAAAVPARAQAKFQVPSVVKAAAVATPTSDFQQDGQPAQWAEGYPKIWGTEEVKFEQVKPHSRSLFGPGAVTPDEKFLIQINDTNTQVINLYTSEVVADFLQTGEDARVTSSSKGGYELLISTYHRVNNSFIQEHFQYHLSSKGTPVGSPIVREGETSSFDPDVFSRTDRRYTGDYGKDAIIFDLDDPKYELTLSGHNDSVMSVTFSPDGKYIATAAWDGTGKLWNGKDGKFIADFEKSTAQNWVVRFSPDSKSLAIASGQRKVKIYKLSDLKAAPLVIDEFSGWVRNLQWHPDGDYIAGGSDGQILVYSTEEKKVVQKWQLPREVGYLEEVNDVTWFSGGSRLAWRTEAALHLYDFDSNLKYQWAPGPNDKTLRGFNVGGTFHLKKHGWIGGFDWDHKVRFFEYPEEEKH